MRHAWLWKVGMFWGLASAEVLFLLGLTVGAGSHHWRKMACVKTTIFACHQSSVALQKWPFRGSRALTTFFGSTKSLDDRNLGSKGAIWEKRPLNSKGPKTHKKTGNRWVQRHAKAVKTWDTSQNHLRYHCVVRFRCFAWTWVSSFQEVQQKLETRRNPGIQKICTAHDCRNLPHKTRSRFTRVDALSDEDLDFRERELETVPCQIQLVFEGIQRLFFSQKSFMNNQLQNQSFIVNCMGLFAVPILHITSFGVILARTQVTCFLIWGFPSKAYDISTPETRPSANAMKRWIQKGSGGQR